MSSTDDSVSAPPLKPLNTILNSIPTTIFSVMSSLAVEHGSVNLGQGFPDDEGPESMKLVAGQALLKPYHNQYPPMAGIPELREAVAKHSLREQGIPVDWATETLITVGATEGIAAAFLGLLNPGDEVIFLDPCYDSYATMARMAGAVVKPVKLSLPNFSLPRDELEAAFGPQTKLILVNSPHNPSGKVFDEDELRLIADLCIKHDVLVLSDELYVVLLTLGSITVESVSSVPEVLNLLPVYEHLVFGGQKHVSIRSLPGMKDRTIRLGSAGKTFSFTAWKVGWMTGPAPLLAPIVKAHQFLVFTVPSSLQRAVAYGLDYEGDFYHSLGPALEKKRQQLEPRLQALGFKTVQTFGAYFIVVDVSAFLNPGETDEAFAKRLTVEAGVTTIPISGFYLSDNPPVHLVRFCFCKDDQKLNSACDRLEAYLKKSAV